VTLTQVQAEAIGPASAHPARRAGDRALVNEYREVVEEIEGYEAILRDESMVLDIIREDIFEMKEKYGDERRTEITGR
jgi:DNA gyrase subunit A